MSQLDLSNENQVRCRCRFKWLVLGCLLGILPVGLLGVVFTPWDTAPPQVPDLVWIPLRLEPSANAATHLEAAARKLVLPPDAKAGGHLDWNRLLATIGVSGEQWDEPLANQILADNAAVFTDLATALACDHCACRQSADSDAIPLLLQCKILTSLLCLKSKRAQQSGDFVVASAAGLQAFRLGQLVANDAGSLIEWQAGMVAQRMALCRLEDVVANPRMPETVMCSIQVELDGWEVRRLVAGFRTALQGDYARQQQILRNLPKANLLLHANDGTSQLNRYRLVPYTYKLNMTLKMLAGCYRHYIVSIDQPYVLARKPCSCVPDKLVGKFGDVGEYVDYAIPNYLGKDACRFFSQDLIWWDKWSRKHQTQAFVEALRLKIALRRYELKYGQLPVQLVALVPEFIQEIPRDPYDDSLFRYSKEDKRVWAVGSDLTNQWGNPEKGQIMQEARSQDQMMPLEPRDLKPITMPPEPKPVKEEDSNPFC
jgi:hypothetical protein